MPRKKKMKKDVAINKNEVAWGASFFYVLTGLFVFLLDFELGVGYFFGGLFFAFVFYIVRKIAKRFG